MPTARTSLPDMQGDAHACEQSCRGRPRDEQRLPSERAAGRRHRPRSGDEQPRERQLSEQRHHAVDPVNLPTPSVRTPRGGDCGRSDQQRDRPDGWKIGRSCPPGDPDPTYHATARALTSTRTSLGDHDRIRPRTTAPGAAWAAFAAGALIGDVVTLIRLLVPETRTNVDARPVAAAEQVPGQRYGKDRTSGRTLNRSFGRLLPAKV